DDQLLPVPINRTTMNRLYGLALDEAAVAGFLAGKAERFARIEDSEQAILARVGRELYETFFRGYTRKQWGLDPSELDASVCGRIPTRTGDDDRHFGRVADPPRFNHVIYTGPIDEYFEFKFGKLPYRSLRFEFETRDVEWAQPAGCVNEPSHSVPFTRTTET